MPYKGIRSPRFKLCIRLKMEGSLNRCCVPSRHSPSLPSPHPAAARRTGSSIFMRIATHRRDGTKQPRRKRARARAHRNNSSAARPPILKAPGVIAARLSPCIQTREYNDTRDESDLWGSRSLRLENTACALARARAFWRYKIMPAIIRGLMPPPPPSSVHRVKRLGRRELPDRAS